MRKAHLAFTILISLAQSTVGHTETFAVKVHKHLAGHDCKVHEYLAG
jgi:hypothetical protein